MGIGLDEIGRLGAGAQRQIAEQLTDKARQNAACKQRKFHNVPTQRVMPGGRVRTFDSKKEAERFDELMQIVKEGLIDDLRIQPHFTLSEAWVTCEGVLVRSIQYVADFSYKTRGGKLIIEDCKGGNATKTAEYQMKKKLMQNRGFTITEV